MECDVHISRCVSIYGSMRNGVNINFSSGNGVQVSRMVHLVVSRMASVEVTRRYRRERDKISGSHGVRNPSRYRKEVSTGNGENRWENVRRRNGHKVKRSHGIEVSKWDRSKVSKRMDHKVARRGAPHFASPTCDK